MSFLFQRTCASNGKHRWAGDILRTSPSPKLDAKEMPSSLSEWALLVLKESDPKEKARWTRTAVMSMERHAHEEQGEDGMSLGSSRLVDRPMRPILPKLVPMREVPKPADSGLPSNAHLLHNLAHVELNAVDLAWDTVARFASNGMPREFYEDFARVADDESRHLGWCLMRLEELGWKYGDMASHDGLWESADVTKQDVQARLAVVPMVQEARGLDAGPRLASRLVGLGDNRSAEIVRQIALEEKKHVQVGVRWFLWTCEREGVDPWKRWRQLVRVYAKGLLRGPFDHRAREESGLPRSWYEDLVEQ